MAGKSKQNHLGDQRGFKDLILSMMRNEGRDFTTCELCLQPIKGKFSLHHMKYEGATYYDLKIACYPCNLKTENKLLN